jgi:hypothetical protein
LLDKALPTVRNRRLTAAGGRKQMKNSLYIVRNWDGTKQDFTAAIEYYGKDAVVVEVARRQRYQNLLGAVMAMRNAGEALELKDAIDALRQQGWIESKIID